MQTEAFDTQVKTTVYHYFAEYGRRPALDTVADRLEARPGQVLAAYERLEARRLLVLEPDRGSIRMAPPFSGVPTQHVVESGGVRYFANCAWDALGIPAALGRAAVVRSRCGHSGESLYLPVGVGGPDACDWWFHSLVPAAAWWDDIGYT